MVTILSRSNWTSTSPGGVGFTWSRIRGLVCHYPAAGRDIGVITKSQEESRIRGWRNYHVNGRGWADLGYNYVICQSGRIYTGRGNRVGAHCAGHNSTTAGILFMVGDNEPLTGAAKKSFKSLRAYLRNKGAGSGVWGHQQMPGASTRCPGPYIMSDIRDGSLKAGSGGGAAKPGSGGGGGGGKYESPTAKHEVGSRVMGKYDSGTDVLWLQKRLYKLGWDNDMDSMFGPTTEKLVKAFQRDSKLKQDGLVGEKTLAALQSADEVRELPDEPKKPSKPKAPKFPLPSGHYFGPRTGPAHSHSGYYNHREHLRTWQKRMQKRGWSIKADGLYGPRTKAVALAFQSEKGLSRDGLIGNDTWAAAWTEPVT